MTLHSLLFGPVVAAALGMRIAAPPPASAISSNIVLDWTAPPTCPDAAQVRHEALRRMGSAAELVVAKGHVVADAGEGFVLELSLSTSRGEDVRRVHARSCAALAEAAGLLIAAAADPSGATEPIDVEPDALPEPPPATSPASAGPLPGAASIPPAASRPPARTRPSRRARTVQGVVRLDGFGQFFGPLPAAVGGGLGGAAGARFQARRAVKTSSFVRIELRARYVFGSTARYDDRPEVRGVFDLWIVGASGCFEPTVRRVSFPLCGGVELGAMRGRSSGLSDDGRAQSLFVGLPLGAGAVWAPIRRLGLWLGTEAVVTLRAPKFHVRGRETLFRAKPAGFRVVAGIELRFP